jgi:hypothetical protein
MKDRFSTSYRLRNESGFTLMEQCFTSESDFIEEQRCEDSCSLFIRHKMKLSLGCFIQPAHLQSRSALAIVMQRHAVLSVIYFFYFVEHYASVLYVTHKFI